MGVGCSRRNLDSRGQKNLALKKKGPSVGEDFKKSRGLSEKFGLECGNRARPQRRKD